MELVAAGLFAVFIWWFSTGAILYLDGLTKSTFAYSMAAATLLAGIALAGIALTASEATVRGAYLAFSCAIICWGWQEMSLYMGWITGPRREPAVPGSSGLVRLGHAIQVILYHELAILLMGLALVVLALGGVNQIGVWTYMILWWMRLSAKINIYLGVPNHAEEFLPDQISYLETYFSRRSMNLAFPFSVTISTIVAAILIAEAYTAPAGSFEATGFALLAALMTLAVIEHWFLVLPIPATSLWSWGLASRTSQTSKPDHTERKSIVADHHHAKAVVLPGGSSA